MNSKVAVGIITYQPEEQVLQRIIEVVESGYKAYIFDNSPDDPIIRNYVKQEASDDTKITYVTCGKNVGLGIGLSALCAQAYYDSFPTILFFDQDTVFSRITLDYISDFYTNNENLAETVQLNYI